MEARLLSVFFLLFTLLLAGCGNEPASLEGCSDLTLNDETCRLNFVFLETRHQSCCEAWLKDAL